jgi:hypothetical protein
MATVHLQLHMFSTLLGWCHYEDSDQNLTRHEHSENGWLASAYYSSILKVPSSSPTTVKCSLEWTKIPTAFFRPQHGQLEQGKSLYEMQQWYPRSLLQERDPTQLLRNVIKDMTNKPGPVMCSSLTLRCKEHLETIIWQMPIAGEFSQLGTPNPNSDFCKWLAISLAGDSPHTSNCLSNLGPAQY